jgi:hypothetical protein
MRTVSSTPWMLHRQLGRRRLGSYLAALATQQTQIANLADSWRPDCCRTESRGKALDGRVLAVREGAAHTHRKSKMVQVHW